MILNKVDLLPYVRFDVERASQFARRLNKDLPIFQVSATSGEGMNAWYDWLRNAVKSKKEKGSL